MSFVNKLKKKALAEAKKPANQAKAKDAISSLTKKSGGSKPH